MQFLIDQNHQHKQEKYEQIFDLNFQYLRNMLHEILLLLKIQNDDIWQEMKLLLLLLMGVGLEMEMNFLVKITFGICQQQREGRGNWCFNLAMNDTHTSSIR
jgi:hypothetical protein